MARIITRLDTELEVSPTKRIRYRGRVHPLAWWIWALAGAITASESTNPLVLSLLIWAILTVVSMRRSNAPWAKGMQFYLSFILIMMVIRSIFTILFSADNSGQILFALPEIKLPTWMAGLRLGGPVSVDQLVYGFYSLLSMSAILLCFGAANSLVNPRRALRNIPGALYEFSVAIVIALAAAPQLIETIRKIRYSRRLRGEKSASWHAVRKVLIPVFEDCIEHAIQLATGMEARGFGTTRNKKVSRFSTALLLTATLLLVFGSVSLLLGYLNIWLPVSVLFLGSIIAVVGLRLSTQQLKITRYRPDPWHWFDSAVSLSSGIAAAMAIWLSQTNPTLMRPYTTPPSWPQINLGIVIITLLLISPVFTTPKPLKEEL